MATFTPNLQLENPAIGATGWGTSENTSRTLVDNYVAGIETLSVAGSANVVLTSVPGGADESRWSHFVLNGALTGNVIVLFPNGLTRSFSVNNATSGSFTLAIGVSNGSGGAAGATVVVPPNLTVYLLSDGTNVKSRFNTFVGGLTVDTLTLINGLGPASGGTGATSLAANNVILGNGVAPVQLVAPGSSGNLLTSDGTTWASASPPSTVPSGALSPFAGLSVPSGWLFCDGSAVSRTTFAALFAAITASATVTITIASPAVVNWTSHGLVAGDQVSFETTGALPTGLSVGVVYFVIASGLTTNAFEVSATLGGAAVNTTGSQSGTQTGRRVPYGCGDGSTTFNVPDARGRATIGKDDMGGTAANRVTAGGSGLAGTILGAPGGNQLMQSHTHTGTTSSDGAHVHGPNNGQAGFITSGNVSGVQAGGAGDTSTTTASAGAHTHTFTSDATGAGGSQNVQPSIIVNYIIKT